MDAIPRRLMSVIAWVTVEVSVTVAERPGRSQERLSMRTWLRPRTPVMVPLASWSGTAGSSSMMPGLV